MGGYSPSIFINYLCCWFSIPSGRVRSFMQMKLKDLTFPWCPLLHVFVPQVASGTPQRLTRPSLTPTFSPSTSCPQDTTGPSTTTSIRQDHYLPRFYVLFTMYLYLLSYLSYLSSVLCRLSCTQTWFMLLDNNRCHMLWSWTDLCLHFFVAR